MANTNLISDDELKSLKAKGWQIIMIGGKDDGNLQQNIESAKEQVIKSGGKILRDVPIIQGFNAIFPSDQVNSLSEDIKPHVEFVEVDSPVTTQC